MRREAFNKIRELMNKPLSRRGMVYVRRLAWSYKKSINIMERDILRKHCGVNKKLNPEHPFLGYTSKVDPITGVISLNFNPDYYL